MGLGKPAAGSGRDYFARQSPGGCYLGGVTSGQWRGNAGEVTTKCCLEAVGFECVVNSVALRAGVVVDCRLGAGVVESACDNIERNWVVWVVECVVCPCSAESVWCQERVASSDPVGFIGLDNANLSSHAVPLDQNPLNSYYGSPVPSDVRWALIIQTLTHRKRGFSHDPLEPN